MKKSILIVGAGFGQIPAINAAKELGLEVIAVDKNRNAAGMMLAHFSYEVDILDKEGVLDIARKHNVNGVITIQSDLPVPTIGYINDILNLKGVSYEVANICSNKNETRKKLKEKNAIQPDFAIISNLREAKEFALKMGFPCVIKSPDSSGSRGITRADSISDVEFAYNEAVKYSRQNNIVVEKFIDGIEFGAQTFSVGGICKMVLLHNDTLSPPPYMIPIGHSFPFDKLTEEETNMAITDIKNAVEAIGISDGPANVDLILDTRTKRVNVIEIGARIGATCLPELVYYHTGIDWIKQTILNAIGENVDLNVKFNKPVAALIIEAHKDGIFKGYEIDNTDKFLEFEITAVEGEKVSMLRKGTDRIGKILIYGNSVKEAENKLIEYRETLQLNIEE